jgi:RNA polymerase sigma-70 factor (ECF subfamily)
MNSKPQSADSLPTRGSLLAAAIGSEPEAWQQLVTLYEPRMMRWCRGQGLDQLAASDVIQDAWMSVARGLASFRSQPGAGAFRAWLHQIVRRRIADYRRRQGHALPALGGSSFAMRLAELPFEGEPRSDASLSEVSSSQTMPMPGLATPSLSVSSSDHPLRDSGKLDSALQQAMATLQREIEPKTWQAFWLCVVDQQSTEQVANTLAMTPANVRQCRSRVLRRLRQTMERPQ